VVNDFLDSLDFRVVSRDVVTADKGLKLEGTLKIVHPKNHPATYANFPRFKVGDAMSGLREKAKN
jgi:hypothetical protein